MISFYLTMINLAYNISSFLRKNLREIESLRRKILLSPLSPKTEIILRWDAMLNRVLWSLALSQNPLSKKEVIRLLSAQQKNKLTFIQQEAVNYKKALDYILQNWLVSTKLITPKTIKTIHNLVYKGKLHLSEKNLKQLLDYLQTSQENPIIQSAIIQNQISASEPHFGYGHLSRLAALLFLYKYGYDFRGFLAPEEYFYRDRVKFQDVIQKIRKGNLTLWLEYATQIMLNQLSQTVQKITTSSYNLDLPTSFWRLNQRQKDILTLLEEPGKTIGNRQIQDRFKVSQITASRYLSKLTALGLLFQHGKGRSVHYSRA